MLKYPFWVLFIIWRLRQIRNTKFGKNVSNDMLANATDFQVYICYYFWALNGNPTRWVKLPPPKLELIKNTKLFTCICMHVFVNLFLYVCGSISLWVNIWMYICFYITLKLTEFSKILQLSENVTNYINPFKKILIHAYIHLIQHMHTYI